MDELTVRNPILIIGIGGAGSKLAVRTGSLFENSRCLLVSNDLKDLSNSECKIMGKNCKTIYVDSKEWANPTSHKLRYLAARSLGEIQTELGGFSTVIVISNLAGRGGIALGPLICKMVRDSGAVHTVISIVIMPFTFQKDRIFQSGVSLRRINQTSHATLVIDNDAMLANNPELSVEKCCETVDTALVETLATTCSGDMHPGLNVLCTGSLDGTSIESSLRDSIAMLYGNLSDASSVKRAMLYVMGAERIPVGTLNSMVNTVQGILGDESSSAKISISITNGGDSKVHLLASAPQKTRFDKYDPLGEIIPSENVLDWDDIDSAPEIDLRIPDLE